MRVEVFNRSKYRDGSDPGDDVPLAVPGQVYGVFDGATDPRGTRVNGIAAGRLAALVVASEMAAAARDPTAATMPGREIIEKLSAGLRSAAGAPDFPIPPSTTLAVALDCGTDWRFLLLGDSGLRINGAEVFRHEKLIDRVSTHARVSAFKRFQSRMADRDAAEMAARSTIFLGFDRAVAENLLTPEDVADITVSTADATGLAHETDLVAKFLSGGIQTQYLYGNTEGHALCFETMNGTASKLLELQDFTRPKSEITSIELFSDGYAALPDQPSAAAWEAEFAMTESADFHRIGRFATVKGSTTSEFFDDRTVVIVAASPEQPTWSANQSVSASPPPREVSP